MKRLYILLLLLLFTIAWGKSAREYLSLGEKALQEKKCYQAADLFKKAISKNRYYQKAYAKAGEAYFCMGNFQESRKFFLKALRFDPENIDYMLMLARIRIETALSAKEYLGAEYYLLKAYKKEPRNVDVLLAYGDYYYKRGKLKKALEFYTKGRESKKNFLVLLKVAKIYEDWGEHEKAYEYLLKAENLNSMDYRTTFSMAKFFLRLKKLDRAKKYFELTLKFYPSFREGLLKSIEFYMIQKDFPQAVLKINELLKLEPESPILYYYLGICYEKLGRFEEAVSFMLRGQKYDFSDEALRLKAEETVIKNLPLGHSIRKKLARYYLINGNLASRRNRLNKAILYYKRGLRLNPLSVTIRKKLAYIYRDKNWIASFLHTLRAGLFVNKNNQELKDLVNLNKRFLAKTLSFKKQVNQFKQPSFYPILYVGNSLADFENRHLYLESEMQEILVEALVNSHSINVKHVQDKELRRVKKMNSLWLRMRFKEDERKIELEAELICLSTGNIYKHYKIIRYGNKKIFNAISDLSKKVSTDVLAFGKILSIDDDIALINLGKRQNLKVKDRFILLNSKTVIDDYYSGNPLRKERIIGEAEVIELDEQIALVRLYKSKQVVFNMININDIVMVKKSDKKKKK